MAQLSDWLNKEILVFDLNDSVFEVTYLCQENTFVDNLTGWIDVPYAEVKWYQIPLSSRELRRFITEAQHWLNLPLSVLAVTYFSGVWGFASGSDSQCNLVFGSYSQTPSKVDWFTVEVYIQHKGISLEKHMHVDRSSVQLMVTGLTDQA